MESPVRRRRRTHGRSRHDHDREPGDEGTLAEIPPGTAAGVDEAFTVGREAQREWRAVPPQERAVVIQRVLGLLGNHGDALADLPIREAGSTHQKSHVELEELAAGMLAGTTGVPTRMNGTKPQSVIPGKENEVRRLTAGIVGVISPWNVPFLSFLCARSRPRSPIENRKGCHAQATPSSSNPPKNPPSAAA